MDTHATVPTICKCKTRDICSFWPRQQMIFCLAIFATAPNSWDTPMVFMIFSHIKHDWKRMAPGCEESCLWVALSSFNATCHWHNYSHKHRCFCLPISGYIATASGPLWFCKGLVRAPSILATKSLGHFLPAQLVQALLKGYWKTPLRAPELNMLYKHFWDQWTTTKIYQNHGQCIHFASSL